jgi:hypothetical protein
VKTEEIHLFQQRTIPVLASGGNEAMIKMLITKDRTVAQKILEVQIPSYRVEAELIGFQGIPPLHDTV